MMKYLILLSMLLVGCGNDNPVNRATPLHMQMAEKYCTDHNGLHMLISSNSWKTMVYCGRNCSTPNGQITYVAVFQCNNNTMFNMKWYIGEPNTSGDIVW